MSSILKALRKVEEQKKGKREIPIDLERQILKGSSVRSSKIILLIMAAMVVGGLGAGLFTFVVMGGLQGNKGRVTAMQAGLPQPATLPEPASNATVKVVPSPKSLEVSAKKAAPPPKPAPIAAPATAPTTTLATVDPQPAVATTIPALAVSGIAYQHENSARMAVVNGQTVVQGGTVSGCRVEEILPDRVRFFVEDRIIEVPVGKPTQ